MPPPWGGPHAPEQHVSTYLLYPSQIPPESAQTVVPMLHTASPFHVPPEAPQV